MNKFSIIVPIYNTEEYLEECLLSLINQTYKNLEIILIDDGSTDNGYIIYNEFIKKDNRISVIRKENEGASIARNIGIEHSNGDYIIFVDSDDWLDLNAVEKINNILEKYNECDLIIYNILYNQKQKFKNMKNQFFQKSEFKNEISKLIKSEKINSPCNKVYKLDIIKKHNIRFNRKLTVGEDLLFNINYIKWINNCYLLSLCLYNYSNNSNSIMHNYIDNKYEQLMYVNNQMINMSYNLNKKVVYACKYIRLKNIYSSLKSMINGKLSKSEISRNIKRIRKENKKILTKDNSIICIFIFYLFYICPQNILINAILLTIKSK